MSRYIDADKALNLFGIGDDDLYAIHTIEDAIYNGSLQIIDAVPVVHGHWVFSENDDMFYCTNCKNGSVRNDYPYCHWCGAKMDEVME